MRSLIAAVAVAALTAGVADAQYKNPTAKPPAGGSVQIPTTPAGSPVQITPGAPNTPITSQPPGDINDARRITSAEAIKMVKGGKAVYIDVRSKQSYDEEHIKGAISIPLSDLAAHYNDLPVGKFLITYCA